MLGLVLFNMAIAGAVGGITNHLAIKMLFHPRKAKYIGSWRVPFTPGLIPKRKDEIGKSLGKVVGDYLVTTEGLVSALQKPELRSKLEGKLQDYISGLAEKEETLEQWLQSYVSAERLEQFKEQAAGWVRSQAERGILWLWEDRGYGQRELKDIVPGWSEERKDKLIGWAVDTMVDEIKQEIMSPNGERMISQMAGQFMEQSGGFLGALAGMFMDTSKLVPKIRAALLQQLDSPAIRGTVAKFLYRKLAEIESKTLSEAVEWMTKEESFGELVQKLLSSLKLEDWLDRLGSMRLKDVLDPRKEFIVSRIPWVVDRGLSAAGRNIDRVIRTMELPKIVEEQVAKFPIELIENIILSVSGKEFRAITWLGVLLGVIIGLMQSVLLLLQQ